MLLKADFNRVLNCSMKPGQDVANIGFFAFIMSSLFKIKSIGWIINFGCNVSVSYAIMKYYTSVTYIIGLWKYGRRNKG